VLVDVDDTIIEVHGYAKQGAGFGYSGVRGLNALQATASTDTAPVVVAQRLRKGSCGSPRGAKRLVADALKTVRTLSPAKPLARADSAFYGRGLVGAAVRAGADVSVTVRLDPKVKPAIATIPKDAWETIEYTDAVFEETTGRWISRAKIAAVDFPHSRHKGRPTRCRLEALLGDQRPGNVLGLVRRRRRVAVIDNAIEKEASDVPRRRPPAARP